MQSPSHFVCDAAEIQNTHRLVEPDEISRFIVTLCSVLGQKRVGDPTVYQFPIVAGNTDAGITAAQILEDSLLSLHTYPESKSCYIDVFSCRPFDGATLHTFVSSWFATSFVFTNRVYRMKYPVDIDFVKDKNERTKQLNEQVSPSRAFVERSVASTPTSSFPRSPVVSSGYSQRPSFNSLDSSTNNEFARYSQQCRSYSSVAARTTNRYFDNVPYIRSVGFQPLDDKPAEV